MSYVTERITINLILLWWHYNPSSFHHSRLLISYSQRLYSYSSLAEFSLSFNIFCLTDFISFLVLGTLLLDNCWFQISTFMRYPAIDNIISGWYQAAECLRLTFKCCFLLRFVGRASDILYLRDDEKRISCVTTLATERWNRS